MDFYIVLEEVALEGLEGITLNALWQRIEDRPGFHTDALDDDIKEFVWKNLVQCRQVNFYKLPEPRPELVLFTWKDHIVNCRCELTNLPENIYVAERSDKPEGIWGSCIHFNTRICVDDQVKGVDGSHMTFKEAGKKWGQELVIVASQRVRTKALVSCDYLPMHMTTETYVILEMIGRSRHNGAVTVNLPSGHGLASKEIAAGCVFILAKRLYIRGYITKQAFNIGSNPGKVSQARLLHLARYYVELGANFYHTLNNLCLILKQAPNHTMEYKVFNEKTKVKCSEMKKHWSLVNKYIAKEAQPYRFVYPDAKRKQYILKNGCEKKLFTYRLIKMFNIGDQNSKDFDEDDDDGDVQDDENENEENNENDNDEDDNKEKSRKTASEHSDSIIAGGLIYEKSFLRSIVDMVYESGTKGIMERVLFSRLRMKQPRLREKTMKCLLKNRLVVRVPCSRGTSVSNLYVSPAAYEERSKEAAQPERIKIEDEAEVSVLEQSVDTSQVKDSDKDDSFISPSTSKSIDAKKSEAKALMLDSIDEDCLDQTLACHKLSWTLEKAAKPVKPDKKDNPKKKSREGFIMRYLEENKVCTSNVRLFLDLRHREQAQGMKEVMCRKSFRRMLNRLYEEGRVGRLTIYSDKFTSGQKHQVNTHIDVEQNDLVVKRGVLEYYTSQFKFCLTTITNQFKEADEKPKPNVFSVCSALDDLAKIRAAQPRDGTKTGNYETITRTEAAKLHGYPPFMVRSRTLHQFMFYVLYGYPTEVHSQQKTEENDINVSKKDPDSVDLPVYLDVQDWRRYIPPLKCHNVKFMSGTARDGQCMLGDLLMSLPIGIFCKIIGITWQVEGLTDILKDPELSLRPLYTMPSKTLMDLCRKRKYVLKFFNSLRGLCSMGLLSFGPRSGLKALEHTILFLHKNVMILNTVRSLRGHMMTRLPPSMKEFPQVHFTLNTLDDVNDYWSQTRLICMGTMLGERSHKDQPGFHGVISLTDACLPAPWSTDRENNWLPGDRRGVAGFDHSLFAHLTRNWFTGNPTSKSAAKRKAAAAALREEEMEEESTIKKPKVSSCLASNASTKVAQKTVKKAKEECLKQQRKILGRKKIVTHRPKKLKRRPPRISSIIADDVDLETIQSKKCLRVRFSRIENGMFLLCHVASYLLRPKSLHNRLPSVDIRTLFRTFLPDDAKDKTTAAIKGKSARLIRDKNFISHLVLFVTKARYDEELLKEYENFPFILSESHRERNYKVFYSLVKKLQVKFSSRPKPLPYYIPPTHSEFCQMYHVAQGLNLTEVDEANVSPSYFNHREISDLQISLMWDLLLGWMHTNQELPSVSVYNILCKYPPLYVTKTYVCLNSSKVMYNKKKYSNFSRKFHDGLYGHEGDNGLILSRRHKDSLRSAFPNELFQNVWTQLERWQQGSKRQSASIAGFSSAPFHASAARHVSSSSAGDKEKGCTEEESQETGQEQDGFSPFDLDTLQGGAVMALLSLMAYDMVKMDVVIPDQVVFLSDEGLRKLAYKKPSGKRTSSDMDNEADDSSDGEGGSPTRVSQFTRTPKRHPRQMKSGSQPNPNPDRCEHSVTFENVQIHFNDEENNHSVLGDLGMASASGTLLVLSRTQLIHQLDLLNTRVDVQRFFLLAPLEYKCALVERSLADSGVDNNSSRQKTFESEGICNREENCGQLTLSREEPMDLCPSNVGESSDSSAFVFEKPTILHSQLEGDKSGSDYEQMEENSDTAITSQRAACQQPIKSSMATSTTVVAAAAATATSSSPLSSSLNPSCSKLNRNSNEVAAQDAKQDRNVASLTDKFTNLSQLYWPEVYEEIYKEIGMIFPLDIVKQDVTAEMDVLSKQTSGAWVSEGRILFDVIDRSGYLGLSDVDLENKVEKPFGTLKPFLSKLCLMNAILRVGTSDIRYVSRRHIKSWTVETDIGHTLNQDLENAADGEPNAGVDKNPVDKTPHLFKPRPWRSPDGAVNRILFHQVLQRILTLLMQTPGLSRAKIIARLNPDILPSSVLDLLEILEELGCVRVKNLKVQTRTTIFGNSSQVEESQWFRDGCQMYDVTACAPICFSFFLKHMEENHGWKVMADKDIPQVKRGPLLKYKK